MPSKLIVINQLRPRIISQDILDQGRMAKRIAKNTTYNNEEIHSILRLYTTEMIAALQAGETVKIDGLLTIVPNMKVGGEVDIALRADRGAAAGLNNPQLWTAAKVSNHANIRKSTQELIDQWNEAHPDDPVTE